MADYDSSLPIRSEADGTDERVHVKVVDYTAPGGAGQQLAITADGEAKVQVQGDNPAGGVEVLRLSELGAPNGQGFYDATDNTKPASVGVIGHTRAASPADTDQIQRVTVKTGTVDTDVHALDISLHDENGNAYTNTNPLPVTVVESEGSEINNHNKGTAVAAAAVSNHDYTVTAATTLYLTQVLGAASGKCKFEVAIETGVATGTFNNVAVFFNSTATPNIVWQLRESISVAAGVRVRVIRTNLDNQSQDLYSTICGHEV